MAYLDDIGFQNWATSRGAYMYNDGDHDKGLVHPKQIQDGANAGSFQDGESPGQESYGTQLHRSYDISTSKDDSGKLRFGTEGTQYGDQGGFFDSERMQRVEEGGRVGLRVGEDVNSSAYRDKLQHNAQETYDKLKANGVELGWYDPKWGYELSQGALTAMAPALMQDKGSRWDDMLPMVFAAVVTAGVASLGMAGVAAAEGGLAAGAGSAGADFSLASAGTGIGGVGTAGTGLVAPAGAAAELGAGLGAGEAATSVAGAMGGGLGLTAPVGAADTLASGLSQGGIISNVTGGAVGAADATPAAGELAGTSQGLSTDLTPANPFEGATATAEGSFTPPMPSTPPTSNPFDGAKAEGEGSSNLLDAAKGLVTDHPIGTALTAASLLGAGDQKTTTQTQTNTTPVMNQDLTGTHANVRSSGKTLTDMQGRPIYDTNGRLNIGSGIISVMRRP